MREILFRGKRADNGEWVEGFPFVRRNTNGEVIDCFIIQEAYEQVTNGQRYVRSNLKSECFRVIPKTIRQFTGLTDKNGKKIFEDDIVKYDGDGNYSIGYVDGVYRLFDEKGYYSVSVHNNYSYLEVIGNIHDNPELLKGGADK